MAKSSSIPAKYTHLQNLLAEQHWQAADEETAKLMLRIAARETEGWLDPQAIAQFPCADLKIMDQLWTEYSHGRFGFKAQKNIWLECGGQISYDTECRLGSRVGWYADGKGWLYFYENNRIFNLTAPPGHLPLLFAAKTGVLPRCMGRVEVMQSAIASRLVNCSCTDTKECQNSAAVSPQMDATYEQRGKTLVIQIPPHPAHSPITQPIRQPGQNESSKVNIKQLWNTQLDKFKGRFERIPESFEADQAFGNFIAKYDFKHERNKYFGLSLFMSFLLVVSLPILVFILFSIPIFVALLCGTWQSWKRRSQVSQRQIFLYQNGMRVICRNQETRVAGRDLMVWRQNVNVVRGNRIQRTDYSYRVRLPHGDEFSVETLAFGEAICQLVLRTQLLEKLNQFDRGESLAFGPVHLTSEAIFVKNKRMDWSKSPQFNIRKGLFYLPLKLFFPTVKCSEIPNLNVLVGILQANDYFAD
jgi:hypothetical protein